MDKFWIFWQKDVEEKAEKFLRPWVNIVEGRKKVRESRK